MLKYDGIGIRREKNEEKQEKKQKKRVANWWRLW